MNQTREKARKTFPRLFNTPHMGLRKHRTNQEQDPGVYLPEQTREHGQPDPAHQRLYEASFGVSTSGRDAALHAPLEAVETGPDALP